MSEKITCLCCNAELGNGIGGFWVIGIHYIADMPENPAVCDAQCLYTWDATGIGLQGHQGFNLADAELEPIS